MRNKDYELKRCPETDGYEAGESYGNAIYNRIFTAINIRKGTLICNPDYGSELYKVDKATKQNETLIKTYVKSALKPLSNILKNVSVSDVNIDTASGKAEFSVKCDYNGQTHNFDYWIKI
ncbi:MAG: hypothetical protein FWF51_12060 [Chitinivibrionia bacterium]|nr:hypothetical protein [Chitinivibrionia bacterium]